MMSTPLAQTIGIDISKKHLDAHAHPCGDARQFANTPPGFAALLKWTGQWPVERIAYEATGIYHRAFEQALTSLPLVQINPLRTRCFAQATGTLAKTDRIDAGVLARMAATFQPDVQPVKSPELAGLAELMNARDGLVRDRTAHKNREKNLLLPLLKRQAKARLEQIARHIDAIDKQAQALITADHALARKRVIIASIKGLGPITAAQLTVIDAFTREALAIDVAQGIKGEQVVDAMIRISAVRHAPLSSSRTMRPVQKPLPNVLWARVPG